MTVGKKKDGRRERIVREEVWREKKDSWIEGTVGGKKTVGREKTAQKSEEPSKESRLEGYTKILM